MKRRFFAQTAATGAISLGLPPLVSWVAPVGSAALLKSLDQLGWSLRLPKRVLALDADDPLTQNMREKNEYFFERGFEKTSAHGFFFGKNEEYCFYPLLRHHRLSRTQDIIMPVFQMDPMHGWSFVQTLNRFQVEAIIKATHSLQAYTAKGLQQYLLPTGKTDSTARAGSFRTEYGSVSVVTRIQNGKATIHVEVFEQDRILIQETVYSQPVLAV